jgi:serine/threonine protein kinase
MLKIKEKLGEGAYG